MPGCLIVLLVPAALAAIANLIDSITLLTAVLSASHLCWRLLDLPVGQRQHGLHVLDHLTNLTRAKRAATYTRNVPEAHRPIT